MTLCSKGSIDIPRFGSEAAIDYLKCRDAEEITRRYRAGYLDTAVLDEELEGWAAEGTWPED